LLVRWAARGTLAAIDSMSAGLSSLSFAAQSASEMRVYASAMLRSPARMTFWRSRTTSV